MRRPGGASASANVPWHAPSFRAVGREYNGVNSAKAFCDNKVSQTFAPSKEGPDGVGRTTSDAALAVLHGVRRTKVTTAEKRFAVIGKKTPATKKRRSKYLPNPPLYRQNARGHPRALGCPRVQREMLGRLQRRVDGVGGSMRRLRRKRHGRPSVSGWPGAPSNRRGRGGFRGLSGSPCCGSTGPASALR